MTRAVIVKGVRWWRLISVRYASRRVRRVLFETYLNRARVIPDKPSSLPRDSIGTALESVQKLRAVLAPRVRC